RPTLPTTKRPRFSLAPGLPGVARWRLAELRYSRAAQCLVALLFHKQRSDVGRVYVRPLTAPRYRRIRIPGTESRLLEIALAASAPMLFVNGRRRSGGGWDWGGLFAVDLRTARVRRVKGLGNRDGGTGTWVSQLLGSDADGRKVHVILARERP